MQLLHSTKDFSDPQASHLILLHGLFENTKNWNSLAKFWSQDFNLHRLNARNHGLSFSSKNMNYKLMAEDVIFYMQENNINKAHIIGHSMGGKTSMTLANMRPDLVKSLSILDISTGAYKNYHTKVLKSLDILNSQGWHSRVEALTALADINLNLSAKEFLLADLTRDKKIANKLFLQMDLDKIKLNYANLTDAINIETIKTPTLLLKGSNSDYVNVARLAQMQDEFTNLEVITLEGGHWIHRQAQTQVFEKIRKFCIEHN